MSRCTAKIAASRDGSTRRLSRIRLSPRRVGQTDLAPLGGDPTQVRGPDFKRLDLSIFKSFRGSGNQRFEFRVEIFNLTNTHNFSVPGFSGGGAGLPPPPGVLDFSNTANFGKITALRLGPNDQRQVQLALKYYF